MAKISDRLSGIFDKQRRAAREIMDAIEGERAKRLALLEERQSIEGAPIDPAESETRIGALLDEAERDAKRYFRPACLVTPSGAGLSTDPGIAEAFKHSPLGAMCLLGFREEFSEALTEIAQSQIQSKDRAFAAEERRDALARVDAAIRDAERNEEIMIRGAEEAGFSVNRRADAPMEFMLAEEL
ncbi:hypothetical protein [Mesorhizobium xinjiangense]|uniref:hypothetical protein n=1 Tax=Mesorhizobium xinjiangense TaxID=2678685 RepID=UPI0012ED1F4E|nr:hypothetical protein [Mesorhizobium xinjiangense]